MQNDEKTTLGLYAGMPSKADVDKAIFSGDYLSLSPTFPEEAIANAVDDLVRLTMNVTEDTAATKSQDGFLYSMKFNQGPGRQPPRFVKVFGLNQLQRVTAVMLLLRKRAAQADEIAKKTQELVAQLTARAEELADEGNRLTRWDFLKMAIIGRDPVIKSIQARRMRENRQFVDLTEVH